MKKISLWQGLLAWSKERFPAVNILSGFLLYAVACSVVRQEIYGQIHWELTDLIFGFALVAHFLLLRVIDEHKDFEIDSLVHPERALQQGWITLRHLKVVGLFAASVTLAASLFAAHRNGSTDALTTWAAISIWTGLMYYEMFCRVWLRKHLAIYSVSHLIIVPIIIIWAATLAAPQAILTQSLPWLAAIAFLNGLIFELLRKTKGADEEHLQVETFSSLWGRQRTVATALAILIASFVTTVVFAKNQYDPGLIAFVPLLGTLILLILSLGSYLRHPTTKTRKANEGAGALFALVLYVTILTLARRR